MTVNLHTSRNRSDWSAIDSHTWNPWQKIAAATYGIITPGNVVSCGGAILVFAGLLHLTHEVTMSGVWLVAVGRLADAIDGYIADRTGTKSLVGEAIDSTMDKLVAIAALITVFAYDLLPIIVTVVIASHTVVNSLIAIIGRLRKVEIHPSLYGKFATFLAWVTILGYLLHKFLEQRSDMRFETNLVFGISWVLFIIFCYLGGQSTLAYMRQVRTPRK